MQPSARILLCTAHVQPFLLAGIKALLQRHPVNVLLVHWPPPKAAPLPVPAMPGLTSFEKTAANKAEIAIRIKAFDPQLVYAPGWMDRDYLGWAYGCRKHGAATIMGMDNQWTGSAKQRLLCLLSRFTLRRIYNYAFVPGERQVAYALKLGFVQDDIRTGLYAPDVSLFGHWYHHLKTVKAAGYPKQFLYLGRLVPHKAQKLIQAFASLAEHERQGWGLLAVGNGPLAGQLRNYSHIRHIAYLAQEDLQSVIAQSGAGCLTSEDEPWGTVVQELAAAGLPLIISSQCGAGDTFLRAGVNGFLCDGSDVASVKAALLAMIALNDDAHMSMAAESNRLGMRSTPERWADTIYALRP